MTITMTDASYTQWLVINTNITVRLNGTLQVASCTTTTFVFVFVFVFVFIFVFVFSLFP